MAKSARWRRLQEIRHVLGDRGLVYFGTRGTDVLPLLELRRPRAVISQIAPSVDQEWNDIAQYCLENWTGRRVDLNAYDIDDDQGPAASELKRRALALKNSHIALVPYRSARFLADVPYCGAPGWLLAPFHNVQRLLEYKPWVELCLAAQGVPVLSWQVVRNGDVTAIKSLLGAGPHVVRRGIGSGGSQLTILRSLDDYLTLVAGHQSDTMAVSPYLENAVPLNINSCVYNSGHVATFALSFQLIGIKGFTSLPLGFCGNDFFAASHLPVTITAEAGRLTQEIGRWLHRLQYRGVFGVDLLLVGERLLVCEINPRFQASTPLCASICSALDEVDPFTEHVAACLGLEAVAEDRCAKQTADIRGLRHQSLLSQLIYYNTANEPRHVNAERLSSPTDGLVSCLPAEGISVDPEGMICKCLFADGVTQTGYEASELARSAFADIALSP
jgi:hypothetical protein